MINKPLSEFTDQEFAKFIYDRLPDAPTTIKGNILRVKLPTNQIIQYTHFHRLGLPDEISIQIHTHKHGEKHQSLYPHGIYKFDTLKELDDIIEISKHLDESAIMNYINNHLRMDDM